MGIATSGMGGSSGLASGVTVDISVGIETGPIQLKSDPSHSKYYMKAYSVQ